VRPFGAIAAALRRVGARRADVVGINRRNVALVYRHNPRRHYPLADDKILAKERLAAAGVPLARTLATCEGLYAVPGVVSALSEHEHFVIKPANGSGGAGIVVVGERLAPGRWRRAGGAELTAGEARKHLADIVFGAYSNRIDDRAFVEERIRPHALFQDLWPDGLCDIRVLTLRGAPLLAMVRVPTSRSGGRANLHQGGLGLAIDLESGRTVRAFSRGHEIVRHPETGRAVVGVALPRWERVVEVARLAAGAVPLGYLGIDVVVDDREEALVLEINARPGLEIQNVNGVGLTATMARLGVAP